MNFPKTRLGNIADFNNGVNFNQTSYKQGVKLIGVSDFGERFSPNIDSLAEIDKNVVADNALLKNGDIVFVRSNGNKALVGRCMLIKKVEQPVTFSGFCIRARFKNLDQLAPEFFAYYFKSQYFRKSISGSSVGTNIQNLNQSILKNTVVPLPDFDVQKRISKILSSYDDLIENNQKQIKLLEEAAQRLYKEWFVDLRFPGYEQTKIVDGVPEGWEKGSLEQIGFFKRGKTITSADLKDGVVPVIAGGIEPAYYHNKANTVAPVVTVSGSGANAGYTSLHHVDVFASDCSYADNLATPYVYFIYCFLKANKACLNNLQKGAAQPHVYAKDINIMNIIVPTNIVLDSFTEAASLYFIKIKNIKQQITLLAEARDRLLPKLMNGEIEV